MMSLSQIHALSDEAARKARRHGNKPMVLWPTEADRLKLGGSMPFPFIGSYVPKGWKLVEIHFVDSTGFGGETEPALTIEAFRSKLKAGMGYAIIEAGQFQVYVGEFQPPKTRKRGTL
jgi:hypothetical protein